MPGQGMAEKVREGTDIDFTSSLEDEKSCFFGREVGRVNFRVLTKPLTHRMPSVTSSLFKRSLEKRCGP